MLIIDGLEGLRAAVGTELGPSDWLVIDQDMINSFAQLTGDQQWIHVDPHRALTGPFGTTIAHGYLTLSLLPQLLNGMRRIDGVKMGVNYGLDRVRFPGPVKSGVRIRARATLTEVTEVATDTVQVTTRVTLEADGAEKPTCVADQLARYTF